MISTPILARMRSRAQLEHDGYSDRAIASAVRGGELHRVDRAWYVARAEWEECYSETRHLMRVAAAAQRMASGSVFSHWSAAVLWQLPLARIDPDRVHVSGIHGNGHVRGGDPLVGRHQVAVPPEDLAEREGVACTSLARTVADALRDGSEETGIALADAALAIVARDAGAVGPAMIGAGVEDAVEQFRDEVRRRLPVGGRGVKRARFILDLADHRAQLPGESVSRLYLLRLGFARPRLQVPIAAPGGGWYYADFGLDDVHAWGEFDGAGKYTDSALRPAGADAAHVVLAEKERENWMRGTTGRPVIRWGSEHITSEHALARRFASFHLPPPR